MEDWERIIERIELFRPDQKVFIWGAGNTSILNHQGLNRENLYQKLRVEAFIDSKLAGTIIYGFPVFQPRVLDEMNPREQFVLISTTNHRVFHEIESICNKKGISCCHLDAAILKLCREKFIQTSNLLDTESRILFNKLLKYRASCSNKYGSIFDGESYFGIPAFCCCSPNDIIVDCGAYVGDSAERYIWKMNQFKQYIAIEPDIDNFSAMQKRFKRLREEWNLPGEKLVAIHCGVDKMTRVMNLERRVNGLGSIAGEVEKFDDTLVQFWALDDLMPKGFSFLKADIESYEYRMLQGTRKIIRNFHPRIAVCIYHSMVDMFSIPQLIHEIEPSYHLSVRHHSYCYEETVLYAY